MTTAKQSRRERQRRSTLEEIVGIARSLVSSGQEVSLRAVAAEMGVTPPALYRYVPSIHGLQALVAAAIVEDLANRLAETAAAQPESDPAARLVAAAVGFRQWAIHQSPEFRLVFTTESGDICRPTLPRDGDSPAPLVCLFADLVLNLWDSQSTGPAASVPAGADAIDDRVARLRDRVNGMPESTAGLLRQRWLAFYGLVALEAFGHLDRGLGRSGDTFRTALQEMLDTIGLGAEWPRLSRLADELATTGWPEPDGFEPDPAPATEPAAYTLPASPLASPGAHGEPYRVAGYTGRTPRTAGSGTSSPV